MLISIHLIFKASKSQIRHCCIKYGCFIIIQFTKIFWYQYKLSIQLVKTIWRYYDSIFALEIKFIRILIVSSNQVILSIIDYLKAFQSRWLRFTQANVKKGISKFKIQFYLKFHYLKILPNISKRSVKRLQNPIASSLIASSLPSPPLPVLTPAHLWEQNLLSCSYSWCASDFLIINYHLNYKPMPL